MEPAKTFMVEDARLIWTNFRGEKLQFNAAGDRYFSVILDPDFAEVLAKDGWAVKFPKPNANVEEEEDSRNPIIRIKVKYNFRPPKIFVITENARTPLTEETVATLDWATMLKVDLIAQAYNWDVGGNQGVAAYLKTMVVTIDEDELELKYGLNEPEQGE